jgi:hypothetical protein
MLERQLLPLAPPVAEPVRTRLQDHLVGLVGQGLAGIDPPRRERNPDVASGSTSRLLKGAASAKDNEIGERDPPLGPTGGVVMLPDRGKHAEHRSSSAELFTGQSRCGARRTRAIRAAAPIGGPTRRGRGPRHPNERCELHPAREDLRTELVELLGAQGLDGEPTERISPREGLGRHEVARRRADIAVDELEPSPGERVAELVGVAPTVQGDLPVSRVLAEGEVSAHGHEQVLACGHFEVLAHGQREVLAGGQVEVLTPR